VTIWRLRFGKKNRVFFAVVWGIVGVLNYRAAALRLGLSQGGMLENLNATSFNACLRNLVYDQARRTYYGR
jgi:hypothetical protein